MLVVEAFMVDEIDNGLHNNAEPYLDLWASKVLIHKRDYLLKKFTTPALAPDVSDKKFNAAKPPEKAEFWFFIDPSTEAGSFAWVCTIFDIDAERVKTKLQPNWRTLYGNYKPVALKAPSEITLQHILYAAPVVKADRTTLEYEIPHITDFKSAVFTGRNTRSKQVYQS